VVLPCTLFSTLFPYTTLFRSRLRCVLFIRLVAEEPETAGDVCFHIRPFHHCVEKAVLQQEFAALEPFGKFLADGLFDHTRPGERSEEHTSELQSRGHLVCRLL